MNDKFQSGSGVYVCSDCGKSTREKQAKETDQKPSATEALKEELWNCVQR